ncbi:MAG: hypothetical protein NVSMB26_22280 [Beijerinckiaceae bacterium]
MLRSVLCGAATLVCALSRGDARADSIGAVSPALCADMQRHHVMNADAPVGCDRLALVRFAYIGFDGQMHGDGEVVVLDAVADHVLAIFAALRARRFPLQQARLMNAYDGDDDASLAANNTSAFNDRKVIGTNAVSMHAYGVAIDINPVQNPYLERVRGTLTVAPKSGADYVKRKKLRPGMAESVIGVFAEHGFAVWGGRWTSTTDYQHFTIDRTLANALVKLPPEAAKARFAAALLQPRASGTRRRELSH